MSYLDKIIGNERAETLVMHGYKKADLHWHTYGASHDVPDSSCSASNIYWTAITRGMDFVTPSDHDTMDGYDSIKDLPGAYPNVEIKIKDKKRVGHTVHVNIPGVDEKQFRELLSIARGRTLTKDDFLRIKMGERPTENGSLYEFLDVLRKEKLPHVYNHPFWFEPGEDVSYYTVSDVAREFPVLEWNAHGTLLHNLLTLDLAERYGKGIIAATDNHSGDIGVAYTLAKGNIFREWFDNVCNGESFMVTKTLDADYYAHEMASFLRGLLELPPEKIDNLKPDTPDFLKRLQSLDRNVAYKTASYSLKKMVESKIPARLHVAKEEKKARLIAKSAGIDSDRLIAEYNENVGRWI